MARTISKPVISEADLQSCERLLVSFSNEFSKVYSPEEWVPNQHFVFHLMDDIRNFGPLHVFQLFAMVAEKEIDDFPLFYFEQSIGYITCFICLTCVGHIIFLIFIIRSIS